MSPPKLTPRVAGFVITERKRTIEWGGSFALLLSGRLYPGRIPAHRFATLAVDACSERVWACQDAGVDPRFEGPPVQLDDLSDVNWTGPRQFYLSSTLGKEGLAVLLTAYSLGETVWVRIAGDGSTGSLITIIIMNKSQ